MLQHARATRKNIIGARAVCAALVASLVAFGVLAGTGGLSPAAAAETASTPLPFALTAQGASGRAQATISLPEGSNPIRFEGRVDTTYAYPGRILFTVGDRRVAELDATRGGAVSFPVRNADMTDDQVTVAMLVQLEAEENCFADDNGRAVLNDARLTYRYEANDIESIGNFLSDGVRSYTVVVPTEPTPAEQSAGLTAVAALAHRYASPTSVGLIASDSPPAATFLNRQVVIRQTTATAPAQNTVRVNDQSQLLVDGTAEGINNAAIALANDNTSVLDSVRANNVTAAAAFTELSGTLSLRDLGVEQVSLEGVGRQEVTIDLSQPQFGQTIQDLTINLVGAVTPLAAGAQGRVDFVWNQRMLTSVELGRSTVISQSLAIPADQLRRQNQLALVLSYVPPGTTCAPPGLSARFDLDPQQSTVTATPGESLAPGFDRFPQALTPVVPVAFGPGGSLPSLMAQAGSLAVALSQNWPQQLQFRAVLMDEVDSAGDAVIVVGATDETTTALGAPLRVGEQIELGQGSVDFGAGLNAPMGYLQAFVRGSQEVILLGRSNYADDQAASDRLAAEVARWVYTNPNKWAGLGEQVVVMGADEVLQTLDLRQNIMDRFTVMMIASGIGLLIVAVAVLAWLWKRPRRKSQE